MSASAAPFRGSAVVGAGYPGLRFACAGLESVVRFADFRWRPAREMWVTAKLKLVARTGRLKPAETFASDRGVSLVGAVVRA